MASSATFEVTPTSFGVGSVHNTKIDFGKLYLRQMYAGSSVNQSKVVQPDAVTGLGETAANNWGIYDGVGSGAQLVAYAQGMHAFAGNWHNWFSMVFELQRFKGSTLQVMGATLGKSDEWAIVGGTGDFAMAYGVIQITEYQVTWDGKIYELTIDGYCRTKLPPVPTPTWMGPWGGTGGTAHEMEGKSRRMESVTIRHSNLVERFSFSYVNEDGQNRTEGPWGSRIPDNIRVGSTITTIKFGPSEFVKGISGAHSNADSNGDSFISAFKIITNIATYGPFGTEPAVGRFNATVPVGKTVVGFFAYDNENLVQRIGLYTI